MENCSVIPFSNCKVLILLVYIVEYILLFLFAFSWWTKLDAVSRYSFAGLVVAKLLNIISQDKSAICSVIIFVYIFILLIFYIYKNECLFLCPVCVPIPLSLIHIQMCIRDRFSMRRIFDCAVRKYQCDIFTERFELLLCTFKQLLVKFCVLYSDGIIVIQLSFNISGHFIAYEQFSFDLLQTLCC